MKKPTPIPPEPIMPPNRLVCDHCGDITETGKHTFFMCRFVGWLQKVFGDHQ